MAKIVLDAEAFKVLASDTRLAILKSLDARPKTVSELAREHELNKATVFEHLQHLVKGELVKKKDSEGRKWVYYALSWKGRSLLHPEQTTFMVLFGLAAIGSFGAIYQLGNWLKLWAFDSLFGGGDGEVGPASDRAETADTMAAEEAPQADDGGGGTGFFDFATDPAFWIFFVLLAATVALVIAAVMVRRRGIRRGPILELGEEDRPAPASTELKRAGRPRPESATGGAEDPPRPPGDGQQ